MKVFRRGQALVQVGCHRVATHLEWVTSGSEASGGPGVSNGPTGKVCPKAPCSGEATECDCRERSRTRCSPLKDGKGVRCASRCWSPRGRKGSVKSQWRGSSGVACPLPGSGRQEPLSGTEGVQKPNDHRGADGDSGDSELRQQRLVCKTIPCPSTGEGHQAIREREVGAKKFNCISVSICSSVRWRRQTLPAKSNAHR